MTFYQQIVSLVDYLLVEKKPEQCPDKKHLTIELTLDTGAPGGNIQIDAVGSWMQGFCVHKFKRKVCNDYSNAVTIHQGDSSGVGDYQRYSVTNTSISVQLENAPYVQQCEHYVSFVLTASKCALHKLHPRLKEQVRVFASQHRDVLITYTVTECLWRLDDKHDQCARMISDAVATVLRYTTTPDFDVSARTLLQARNNSIAKQAMHNLIYERTNIM